MIFGHLIIVSVAVLLSSVAGNDAGLHELPVTNENGSLGLYYDTLCRNAGFVPIKPNKVPPTKKSMEDDKMLLAGAAQTMSASTIILVVLSVVVVIISTIFLGNFLYNKAKAHEYTL